MRQGHDVLPGQREIATTAGPCSRFDQAYTASRVRRSATESWETREASGDACKEGNVRREVEPFRGPVQRVSHAHVKVFAHDHRLEIPHFVRSPRPRGTGPARDHPTRSASRRGSLPPGAARSPIASRGCLALPRPGSTRMPSRCTGRRRSPSVRTSGPAGSSLALHEPGPRRIPSRTSAKSLPWPHEMPGLPPPTPPVRTSHTGPPGPRLPPLPRHACPNRPTLHLPSLCRRRPRPDVFFLGKCQAQTGYCAHQEES